MAQDPHMAPGSSTEAYERWAGQGDEAPPPNGPDDALAQAKADIQRIACDLLKTHHGDDMTGSRWVAVIEQLYDAVDNGASEAAR